MKIHFQHGVAAGLVALLFSCMLEGFGRDESRIKIVKVKPTQDLAKIVDSAKPDTLIKLEDGTYPITRPLIFRQPRVSLLSASGRRDKVILDGQKGKGKLRRENCVNEVISIRASNVRIAHLSVRHARDHGIHISPANKGDLKNVYLQNLHVYDCGQQLIKVNSNGGKPTFWTDDCVLEDSLIEFQDTSIMHDMGKHFYTGGIDVHGGKNWIIRRNTFRNIQREGKMMEHAVHMWSCCRGTLVEQNQFIDCYRAVGFGMKTKPQGFVRSYPDGEGSKPYFDHVDGVIRNNFIFNRKGIHLESGIELMNVKDVKVYHNTVVSQDKPFSSIEYRWPNTRVEIINNIVSHTIQARNGAKAILKGNIQSAPPSLFKDYQKGDLHLSPEASGAVDKGIPLKDDAVEVDIDGDKRDAQPDIGADER